ncbi:hypothetical protein A2U01_0107736, partial [Trifolium medium]|nr:hypothetical protein [Trifolium medium]
GDAAQRAVY